MHQSGIRHLSWGFLQSDISVKRCQDRLSALFYAILSSISEAYISDVDNEIILLMLQNGSYLVQYYKQATNLLG